MSDPYLGEIKLISFNFPPKNWAMCNGQLLPINQNQALFSLLGTTYGGNGQTTFGLPDLRGRVAMHFGNGHTQGERSGTEGHVLTIQQLPAHTHPLAASKSNAISSGAAGTVPTGGNKVMAQALAAVGKSVVPVQLYGTGAVTGAMAADTLTNVGSGQAHENRQPYLALNYIIALVGLFPTPD